MFKRTRFPGVFLSRDGTTIRIRGQAINPKTGKPKEVDRRIDAAATTIADASKLRIELLDEIASGADAAPERKRLKDYAGSWLATKLPGLKPSTARRYAVSLDLHVLPDLGDVFLDALTATDVREWTAKHGRNDFAVLRAILRDATAELNLPRDPTQRIRAKPVRAYSDDDPNLLTADDLRALLDAMRAGEPQWYPLTLTLALTGLRWGEATALRWEDVDEQAGIIRVRRSHWRTIVGTPKTGKVRTVPLPAELAAVLREHRMRLVETQAKGLADGWVFPSAAGKPHQPSALGKPLARARTAAGIGKRLTTHGLRRTANNLLRQVASAVVVRSVIGHSTEAMHEHYSVVGMAEKQAAAARVMSLIRGESRGQTGDQAGDRAVVVDGARAEG